MAKAVKKVRKRSATSATLTTTDTAPAPLPTASAGGAPNDFEVHIFAIILKQNGAEVDTPLARLPLTVEGAASPDSSSPIVTVALELTGPGAPPATSLTSAVTTGSWGVTFPAPSVRTVTGGTVRAVISAFGQTSSAVRRFSFAFAAPTGPTTAQRLV